MERVFSEFWFKWLCWKRDLGILVRKMAERWPWYDNTAKMFNIKSLCYQRINCEKFFKLWSEKCKMLCYINHDILVTMVTKRTRWPPLFLLKFTSGTLKESLYQIWGKFMEWKLRDRITLRDNAPPLTKCFDEIRTCCFFSARQTVRLQLWIISSCRGYGLAKFVSICNTFPSGEDICLSYKAMHGNRDARICYNFLPFSRLSSTGFR